MAPAKTRRKVGPASEAGTTDQQADLQAGAPGSEVRVLRPRKRQHEGGEGQPKKETRREAKKEVKKELENELKEEPMKVPMTEARREARKTPKKRTKKEPQTAPKKAPEKETKRTPRKGTKKDTKKEPSMAQSDPGSDQRYVLMLIMHCGDSYDAPDLFSGVDAPGMAKVFTTAVKGLWSKLIVAGDKEAVHCLKARWDMSGLAWELKQTEPGVLLAHEHIAKTTMDGVIARLEKNKKTMMSYGMDGLCAVVVPEGHSHEEWVADSRTAPGCGVIGEENAQVMCLALMCKAWNGKLHESHRKGVPHFIDFRVGEDMEVHSP